MAICFLLSILMDLFVREAHLALPDALYLPERSYRVRIHKSGRAALSS